MSDRMKRIACAIVLAASTCTPVMAIPGQTSAQALAWGKSNAAFRDFRRNYYKGPDGPGSEYVASLKIDGHDVEFHAKLNRDGSVRTEVFVFLDISELTEPAENVDLFAKTIASAYGAAYASDFKSAQLLPNTGSATLWRGKSLGYAGFGTALAVFTPKAFDRVTADIRKCGAIDCSPAR